MNNGIFGYFFYSKTCRFCDDLFKLMQNHDITKHFKLECIDLMNEERRARLPFNYIPAIVEIIKLPNEQQKQILYEKEQAFERVKTIIINRRQSMLRNVDNSRRLIQEAASKNKLLEKLYEYCPNEQSGISDNYTICKEDVNIALPKSFTQYDQNLGGEKIVTIPIADIKKYKEKEGLNAVYGKDIKHTLTKIENDRKQQDDAVKNAIDQRLLIEAKTTMTQTLI